MTGTEALVVALFVFIAMLGMPSLRWFLLRSGAGAEVSRKSVHVLLGLGCVSFPWLFEGPSAVWVLAALISVPLLVLRIVPAMRSGVGSVLHGVGRLSYGDILFAPAVASLFHLAHGNVVLYLVPLLILVVSDAAGALFGTRFGKRPYRAGEGLKSVEGSAMFLATAFLCCFVPLICFGATGFAEAVMISLILATLGMMAEGLSDRGFDNLVIPLGCHYALERIIGLNTTPLVIRLIVLVLLLSLVLKGARWSTLSGGALLGAVLFGYGCAILGDWRMALPPVVVFLCHLATTRKHGFEGVLEHRLDAVLSQAIGALPWAVAYGQGIVSLEQGLAGVTFAMVVQLVILKVSTAYHLAEEGRGGWGFSLLQSWLIVGPAGLIWLYRVFPAVAVACLMAVPLSGLALVFFHKMQSTYDMRKTGFWVMKGLLALLCSLPALYL